MNIKSKIMAAAGGIVLAGTLGVIPAHAGTRVPPPLTERTIVSDQGLGNAMSSCDTVGNTISFGIQGTACPGGGAYDTSWFFKIGTNGTYELQDGNGHCVTWSTTQTLLKDEVCGSGNGAANQQIKDINEGGGTYLLFNPDLGTYANDPHTGDPTVHVAGTETSNVVGFNGWSMSQF